ncbi:MAG: hypothetical protein AAGI38_00550 [Bacteroidota bacterium]
MEHTAVNRLMRIINTLSPELKLELLSQLSDNVRKTFTKDSIDKSRENKLEELFGAWSDTENNLDQIILESRTGSDKDVSFD